MSTCNKTASRQRAPYSDLGKAAGLNSYCLVRSGGLDLGLPLRWDYAGSFCGGG
jgi:hypothetical protein